MGIIFLPFTTLIYVLLWTPGIGIGSLGWFWLLLTLLLDIGGWGSTGYANRNLYYTRRRR